MQVVNVLRAQLAQLDEVKREREVLEGEVKAVTFDLTTKFLTALAQDGAINEEALTTSELDTRYGSHTQRVQQNLRRQEELLSQIQVHTNTHTSNISANISARPPKQSIIGAI